MGIYAITNKTNGKSYVGSSVNMCQRFKNHRTRLLAGTHENSKLQKSWNKHGEKSFRFHVLDYVDYKEELIITEQQYIDSLRPEYNILPLARNSLGIKRRQSTKDKISLSKKGKPIGPQTNEHKSKLRQSSYWGNRTHCSKGHEYTVENTYNHPKGYRQCRVCTTESHRKSYARK